MKPTTNVISGPWIPHIEPAPSLSPDARDALTIMGSALTLAKREAISIESAFSTIEQAFRQYLTEKRRSHRSAGA